MAGDMEPNKLMEAVEQMRHNMQLAKDELNASRFQGAAGGDAVQVEMDGEHKVLSVSISAQAHASDKAELEDMLTAAINQAVTQVEMASRNQLMAMARSLDLPDFEDMQDKD